MITIANQPGVTDLFIKANVMIDENGQPRLADFGIRTFVSNSPKLFISNSSFPDDSRIRWMSPELFDPVSFEPENSQPTKGSDCYALGMVILEVLSGEPPFVHDYHYSVTYKVVNGEHPGRPEGAWCTDALWRTMRQCWSRKPYGRPTAKAVLQSLEQASKL